MMKIATAILLASVTSGVAQCVDGCRPGDDISCKKGDVMDIIFAVGAFGDMCTTKTDYTCGTNPAKVQGHPACIGKPNCVGYKTHAFCDLKPASDTDRFLDIVMYGAGPTADNRIPDANMTSRTAVVDFRHPGCNGTIAIANFLVYNVTLDNGKYKTKRNAASGNGFVPTCTSDDKCDFDTNSVCIKNPAYGHKGNCGVCKNTVKVAEQNTNDVRILLSYYGTDSGGRVMLSGSSNPLNFRQFAITDIASKIGKDIRNVKFP